MGVVEQKSKRDEQLEVLLGVVEGLRQEVKSLQGAVQCLELEPMHFASIPTVIPTLLPQPASSSNRRRVLVVL